VGAGALGGGAWGGARGGGGVGVGGGRTRENASSLVLVTNPSASARHLKPAFSALAPRGVSVTSN